MCLLLTFSSAPLPLLRHHVLCVMIFLIIYIIAIILIPCYISADNAFLYITLIIVYICHISLKRTPWEGLSWLSVTHSSAVPDHAASLARVAVPGRLSAVST